jgi:hypothetical protein
MNATPSPSRNACSLLDAQLSEERLVQLGVGAKLDTDEFGVAGPDDGAVAGKNIRPQHVGNGGNLFEQILEALGLRGGLPVSEQRLGIFRTHYAANELLGDHGIAAQHIVG